MKKERYLLIGVVLFLLLGCKLSTTRPEDLIDTATPVGEISLGDVEIDNPEATATEAVTPTPEAVPTATLLPGSIGPSDFPENVNPLTGMVMDDPGVLDRRPVSVKINNYPRSNRPQWGLSLADIVYEFYHNNDLPRFHAIFLGNDAEQVGPIRSGRLFDRFLVDTYGSIFTFASADSRILEVFRSQDFADRLIYFLDGECPPHPVCRYMPESVNYLIGDTRGIRAFQVESGGDNARQDLHGMVFNADFPPGGQDLQRLYVRYSYSAYLYWEYDPATGGYFRYQDTQEDINGSGEAYAPLRDGLTDKPIATDNVVVLVVDHFHEVYQPPTGSHPKVEIVDMDFLGNGPAYAMRDGKVYELQWVRPPTGELVYLIFPDGSRYSFKPGTTWFEVVSQDTLLEKTDQAWRFLFTIVPPS